MATETQALSNDMRAKLEEIFRAVFELPAGAPVQHIRQINFRKWDSLGHVLLIAAVESEFGRSIDPTQSLQLTSFESMELYLTGSA
jgi:acyl carrier protein